ncbi:putative chaperone clpB [Tribonema minus]|uniref:Putative chaperone clpB n=1 Tax=Tribonema minus TaxID=303371 RepID=A0A835ZB20_9STRA|nr:putative chaperone clpB [Tribonema minus]
MLSVASRLAARSGAASHRWGCTHLVRCLSQEPRAPWVAPEAVPVGEALKKYGKDLTQAARDGKLDPVIGRDDEIRRTVEVLSRRRKNNPVLIGEPGVGKTAIAEGLARRIVAQDVPESMKNKQVIALDLAALVAGAKFRGEYEERLRSVLRDVERSHDRVVLFIDEMHQLVGAGAAEGGMDASNMLKPALARGDLRCMGATTLDEYRKYIEKDAALARRLQPVYIAEPDVEATVTILRGLKERYEVHHGVRISDAALVAASRLAHRYLTERKLPDSAIDLIDEAASRMRMQQESKPEAIEKVEREIAMRLIEIEALRKETDRLSRERLEKLQKEVEAQRAIEDKLMAEWRRERERLVGIKRAKQQLEEARRQAELAQQRGEWARAGELTYSEIPRLEAIVAEADAAEKADGRGSGGDAEEGPLERRGPMLGDTVTEQDVGEVVSRATGVPIGQLLASETRKLLHMEDALAKRVVGQDDAIKAVSNCVRLARAGLRSHTRPLGVFMFLGPTGVGKTELTKALAEFLFQSESAIVRVDMSEYMERFSVSRLIGAPPGYVGYEEGGTLTEAVRRRPYQVILLDEFEKAHREVANLLLQVFDEGRLTDSQGRVIDFRSTLIIMTSNLGSDILYESDPDLDVSLLKPQVMARVAQHFPPEFLNRVDDMVLFNRLKRAQMSGIVEIQLKEVQSLLSDKRIILETPPEVVEWLADTGFDPRLGARPLKRAIAAYLLDPLANLILESRCPEGSYVKVRVGADNRLDFDITTDLADTKEVALGPADTAVEVV